MKALTIHQPWASALAEGAKTIENRRTLWKYRGPLAVHASKTWDHAAGRDPRIINWYLDELASRGWFPTSSQDRDAIVKHYQARGGLRPEMLDPDRSGAFLGVVVVDDVHVAVTGCCPGNVWADRRTTVEDKITHLVVSRPRLLPQPIPYAGKQGLWRVPNGFECDQLRDALRRTA